MVLKVNWHTPGEESTVQTSSFSLRSYYLTATNLETYVNCEAYYDFSNNAQTALESAIIDKTFVLDNITIVMNNGEEKSYPQFKNLSNYTHRLDSNDYVPILSLQFN